MKRLLLAAAFTLLTACTPAAVPPTLTPSPPPPPPQAINPLTGLAVPLDVLTQPPVIVKISNAPDEVRPQAGIGAADHVYEHYVEGGLTRFSAIYWTLAPERIGSVRSARLIDLELIPMYDAVFAYSGASDGVLARLMASDRFPMMFNENNPAFFRDPAIAAPHNLFLDLAALRPDSPLPPGQTPTIRTWDGLTFDETPPAHGLPGRFAVLRYRAARVEWVWDGTLGQYRRLMDGQPHTDALTGESITAANVVIVYAPHFESEIVESVGADGTIFYSLNIGLAGRGEAVLLRDGRSFSIGFTRSVQDQPLRFIDADGFAVPFAPGRTWFQIFPLPEDWLPGEELARVG